MYIGDVLSLLVVDPDPNEGQTHREILERDGYSVSVESDAPAALAHLREGGIDAIMVDSAISGFEELMAGVHKLPDPPPLILHSNRTDAPQASARFGAAQFLPKPCSPEELLNVVADIVGVSTPITIDDEPTYPVQRSQSTRADTER